MKESRFTAEQVINILKEADHSTLYNIVIDVASRRVTMLQKYKLVYL
mgnify:CR=1 FL=1